MSCIPGLQFTDTLQIGLFLGLAIKLCFGNLTNPGLYELRQNRRVFFSVTIGSICCLCYYIFSAPAFTFGFSAQTQHMFSSIFWFQAANDFCLFVLLVERLLPVLKFRQYLTKTGENIFKIVVPCILVVDQVILASIISRFGWPTYPPPTYERAMMKSVSSVNVMIGLGCNFVLTIFFLRSLMANREGTLLTIIKNNKREWLELLFDFSVGLFLILCRLVSYGTPTGIHPGLTFFTGMAYPIVILATYKNYIFITRYVAKEILQTSITVTPKTAKESAVTGTKGTVATNSGRS
ncbi:hypothetical protein BKA69DRAFT_79495 [Paraphysoderma sedebokerense]|nr:hypothetical protein BKA69DRAFT_79495 [Paraphysoderma sedebokerense]